MYRFSFLILGIVVFLFSLDAFGRPGDLDRTFGTNGIGRTAFTMAGDIGRSKYQNDGKIVAVGEIGQFGSNEDFYILRFNSDGSLDTTFGDNGRVIFAVSQRSDYATAVDIQADGKIVVCGYSRDANSLDKFAVLRLNSDGTPDNTFGTGGFVITSISTGHDFGLAVVVQDDGRIVVAGSAGTNGQNFALVRYKSDGSLDETFDGDGKVVTRFAEGVSSAETVTIDTDGRIIAAGATGGGDFSISSFGIARYMPNGSPDTTFGTSGTVVARFRENGQPQETAKVVHVQPNGEVFAAGYMLSGIATGVDWAVLKLKSDGVLDGSFGNQGKVVTALTVRDDIAYAISVQDDGKLLVGGAAQPNNDPDIAVVRYNPDGSYDETFGLAGKLIVPHPGDAELVSAMRIRGGNRLVVGGFTRSEGVFANISLTGSRESDFDNDGLTDISIFRPSSGAWYLQRSRDGLYGAEFGYGTDKIAPAEYDGDGKTDIAVYRPDAGIWYVFQSSTGTVEYTVFGLPDDLPTTADYDGDGKADVSVFRPSTATWYRRNSSDGSFYAIQFGLAEDKPTIGDFDGDGKSDIAIFRPSDGAWYELYSGDGSLHGRQFGFGTDIITPADYDGDGKTDIAVYRPSEGYWYIANSSDGSVSYAVFGLSDDIPAPGDFDGDGKADISIFRPSDGTWYRTNSSDGSFYAFPFGATGDKPTMTAFTY